jgi:catechol 2,3-dioxygenase-like lactoylglutathione lyase family enzyme
VNIRMNRPSPSSSRAPLALAALLVALPVAVVPVRAQQSPGKPGSDAVHFVEEYALATDRSAVVSRLVPGSEDWYYWRCRERLDARDFTTVRTLLPDWIERHGRGDRVVEIENRAALLNYDADPDAAYALVRDRLGLRFDHRRNAPGTATPLLRALDPALLQPARLRAETLARHPGTVDGFTDDALAALAAAELDEHQLRSLLQRLPRVDVPNLADLVVRDLGTRSSRGFGSLPIHGRLLLAQLERCLALRPDLLIHRAFVDTWLRRLEPNTDHDWRADPASRRAHLERLLAFAQRLGPQFHSLKAQALHHFLLHDLGEGAPDRRRLMAYVRLPRQGGVGERAYAERFDTAHLIDLGSSHPTGLPACQDDAALLRTCLEHVFVEADGFDEFVEFLDTDWLRAVFAETKLLHGRGDLARWQTMIGDPGQLQRIERRVELTFPLSQPRHYAADAPVAVELDVKNVDHLVVKVYAVDAYRYHQLMQKKVDATIELDGVVPNHELSFRYDEPPIRRTRRRSATASSAAP